MSNTNKIGDLIAHPKIGLATYRVTGTAMTGGGTMGRHDSYPDGHQLTLMEEIDGKIDWSKPAKKFYQTGCFINKYMLPYCEPLKQ